MSGGEDRSTDAIIAMLRRQRESWLKRAPLEPLITVVRFWRRDLGRKFGELRMNDKSGTANKLILEGAGVLKATADALLVHNELHLALEMYTNMLSLFFSETCVLTVVLDLTMQLECWTLMNSILEKMISRGLDTRYSALYITYRTALDVHNARATNTQLRSLDRFIDAAMTTFASGEKSVRNYRERAHFARVLARIYLLPRRLLPPDFEVSPTLPCSWASAIDEAWTKHFKIFCSVMSFDSDALTASQVVAAVEPKIDGEGWPRMTATNNWIAYDLYSLLAIDRLQQHCCLYTGRIRPLGGVFCYSLRSLLCKFALYPWLLLQTTTHVLCALIAYPRSEQLVDAYDRDAGAMRGANMPIDQLNVQRAVQHLCMLLGTDYVPVKRMPVISRTLDPQTTAPPKTPLRTCDALAQASPQPLGTVELKMFALPPSILSEVRNKAASRSKSPKHSTIVNELTNDFNELMRLCPPLSAREGQKSTSKERVDGDELTITGLCEAYALFVRELASSFPDMNDWRERASSVRRMADRCTRQLSADMRALLADKSLKFDDDNATATSAGCPLTDVHLLLLRAVITWAPDRQRLKKVLAEVQNICQQKPLMYTCERLLSDIYSRAVDLVETGAYQSAVQLILSSPNEARVKRTSSRTAKLYAQHLTSIRELTQEHGQLMTVPHHRLAHELCATFYCAHAVESGRQRELANDWELVRLLVECPHVSVRIRSIIRDYGKATGVPTRYCSDVDSCRELVNYIPTDWTLLQVHAFMKLAALVHADVQCDVPAFLMRLRRHCEPIVAVLSRTSKLETLVNEQRSLLAASDRTLQISDSQQFWRERNDIDQRLKHICVRLQNEIIGAELLPLFMGTDRENASGYRVRRAPVLLTFDSMSAHLPWETIAAYVDCLQPMSRIASLHMLVRYFTGTEGGDNESAGSSRAVAAPLPLICPDRGYYLLDPTKEFERTQTALGALFRALKWRGLIAEMPDRQTVLRALESEDLFLFAGHGSMSTIVGASRLAQQTVHAVTVLMGCASTSIRQSEQHSLLEARSTSDEYALAQCPTLVGCRWSITDREIDRLTMALFCAWLNLKLEEAGDASASLRLTDNVMRKVHHSEQLLEVLASVRRVCKLPYLTGAACVAYGLPALVKRK